MSSGNVVVNDGGGAADISAAATGAAAAAPRVLASFPTIGSLLYGLDPVEEEEHQPNKDGQPEGGEDGITLTLDVALGGVAGAWIRRNPQALIEFEDGEVNKRMKNIATQHRAHRKQSLGFKVGPFIGTLKVAMSACRIPSLNAGIFSADDSLEYLFDDPAEMFRRFERDGYVLLRGLIDKNKVALVRREASKVAKAMWNMTLVDMVSTDKAIKRATRGTAGGFDVQIEIPTGVGWLSGLGHDANREEEEIAAWLQVARSQLCTDVLDGGEVRTALDVLAKGAGMVLGGLKFDHAQAPTASWLRVRGTGFQAPEATDYYHMRQYIQPLAKVEFDKSVAREAVCPSCNKSRLMYSSGEAPGRCPRCPKPVFAVACWVPLGPWPVDGGTLAILPGSHRFSGFIKGPSPGFQTPKSFKTQADGQPWVVCALDPGDVLLLDVQVITAGTENRREGYFRGSLDKRVLFKAR